MRQLPTLPARCQASTLGSMRLNFRVRYENGWIPHDIVTAMAICAFAQRQQHRRGGKENKYKKREGEKINQSVLKSIEVLITCE